MDDLVPVVDLGAPDAPALIDRACREVGFFALAGHGIAPARRAAVIDAARRFFALPQGSKRTVSLAAGGRAWRGWFRLGGELTSGVPDLKEGYYFGRELSDAAAAGRPLHGPNLWPAEVPELRDAVLGWMSAMESLGQRVLAAMAVGMGLDADWFATHLTADPTCLFRIFTYPPHPPELRGRSDRWGVAEHTDYGLLTLLAHDGTPGLEVHVGDRWIEVPSDPDLIVCNLGDMLDRLTAGRYRSTPHRVRNDAPHDRISLPFFLDPSWDVVVQPIPLPGGATRAERERWDAIDLSDVAVPYGEWLVAKVSKVFPDLATAVLP